jgi:Copper type II ascorbate-dependent monooxygenase, N-terminal domain/Copper type II ascorbate-dependent monooxygenase, C-terminal domain
MKGGRTMNTPQRIARGFALLGGIIAVSFGVITSSQYASAVTRVDAVANGSPLHQGHFVNENRADVPWTLSPTLASDAASSGEKLSFPLSTTAYTPSSEEGLDDYHCFLVNPNVKRDAFITAVNIKPGNAKVVHHVILFKMEGKNVNAALEKNARNNGKGWTCFGGPDVGDRTSVGGSWIGAWAPGAGEGGMPAGIGIPVEKGSLIVAQVHYNLANGVEPDRSSAEITLAPEGVKLKPLRTQLLYAPVELPCADGINTPNCQRDTIMKENLEKFGRIGAYIPTALLQLCERKLETYQNGVGDASRISTSCERPVRADATLYSIAGHMHVRGRDIRIELNPGTSGAKTLLHIPKWDFHWQGNYWFRNPVEIKAGDRLKISCTYDNSAANQPVFGNKPAESRYIVWGEGTGDEMCLGVTTAVVKQ